MNANGFQGVRSFSGKLRAKVECFTADYDAGSNRFTGKDTKLAKKERNYKSLFPNFARFVLLSLKVFAARANFQWSSRLSRSRRKFTAEARSTQRKEFMKQTSELCEVCVSAVSPSCAPLVAALPRWASVVEFLDSDLGGREILIL
jgi:hypothetical protein